MKDLKYRLQSVVTLFVFLGVLVGIANAAETDPDGALYPKSANALSDVQQALDRADLNERLALVVMGANWCHDSRALAARLHRSPLAEVIQEKYELVFVDVGFYENGRDVAREFNVAHYYATPTVLIIEPSTGQLVNDEDRHIWGNAYNIDMPSSVRYFEKWAMNDAGADPATGSAELQQLYAQIDQFELQQAERVAAGYAVVGPKLAAAEAGNEPDDFDSSWGELRDFRMAIPGDVRKLRDEAKRRISDGEEDIQLSYPEYPSLSWEQSH